MTKSSQDLIEEHGGIMLMLSIMKRIAKRLRNGEEVDKAHLVKVIEFLKNFADKCHHGKEEDIYFPEVAKNSSNIKGKFQREFEGL